MQEHCQPQKGKTERQDRLVLRRARKHAQVANRYATSYRDCSPKSSERLLRREKRQGSKIVGSREWGLIERQDRKIAINRPPSSCFSAFFMRVVHIKNPIYLQGPIQNCLREWGVKKLIWVRLK